MKRRAAGKTKKSTGRRQGGRSNGEGKGPADSGELRVNGEGRWQRMELYSHNDPAALYRADKAAWQQMRLHEADPDVVAYQEIKVEGEGQRSVRADVRQGGEGVPAGLGTGAPAVGAQRTQRCTGQEGGSEGTKGGV